MEYIRLQRNLGVPDYKIVSGGLSALKNMRGGVNDKWLPQKYDNDLNAEVTNPSNADVPNSGYEYLTEGLELYHPTTEVRSFSKEMIFTNDLPKIMNLSTERKLCVFFTTEFEYAKRFSGLWSLNKRNVYIHKLRVKKLLPEPRVKVFDSRLIQSDISNQDLASSIYGITDSGMINGIKIVSTLQDGSKIDEYYICHPETLFTVEETWMQIDQITWAKIDVISNINIKKTELEPIKVATPPTTHNEGGTSL